MSFGIGLKLRPIFSFGLNQIGGFRRTLEDSDFVHLNEDGTKLKIPSEITPTFIQNHDWYGM